jgi:hypothetical protein
MSTELIEREGLREELREEPTERERARVEQTELRAEPMGRRSRVDRREETIDLYNHSTISPQFPNSSVTPRICGLLKVHKDGVPLRPIANTINDPTYKLAKFLAKKLQLLVDHIESSVKDSKHFVDILKQLGISEQASL